MHIMKKRCRVYKPTKAEHGFTMTQDSSTQSVPQQRLQKFVGSVNQASQNYMEDEEIADQVAIMKAIGQEVPQFKEGGAKNWIQKANKSMKRRGTVGKFTEYCGGKVTADCIERGLNSPDPKVRKRAAFAKSMRSIAHKQYGGVVEDMPMMDGMLPMYAQAGQFPQVGSSLYGSEDLLNPNANTDIFKANLYYNQDRSAEYRKKGMDTLKRSAYDYSSMPTRYKLNDDVNLFDDPNIQLDQLDITGYKPGKGGKTSTLSVRATGTPKEPEVPESPIVQDLDGNETSVRPDDWQNSYYNPQPAGPSGVSMGMPETPRSFDDYLKTLDPNSMNMRDRRALKNYMMKYGGVRKAQAGYSEPMIGAPVITEPVDTEFEMDQAGTLQDMPSKYVNKFHHYAPYASPEEQYYMTMGDRLRNFFTPNAPRAKQTFDLTEQFAYGGYLPKAQLGLDGALYPGTQSAAQPYVNPLTGESSAMVLNPESGSYEMTSTSQLGFERNQPNLIDDRVVSEKDLTLEKQSRFKTWMEEQPFGAANAALGLEDLVIGVGRGSEAALAQDQLYRAMDPTNKYKAQEATRGDYTFNYPLGPHLMPDKYTRWGDDTKVARDGMAVGDELELSEEEIAELLRQGYQLEYV